MTEHVLPKLDIVAVDVNGDGFDDLATANIDDPNLVWINDGNGNFVDSGQRLEFFGDVFGIAAADFDDDGDNDLISTSFFFGQHIWLNDGSGNFAEQPQILGDLEVIDNDFFNNPPVSVPDAVFAIAVVVLDVNGDFRPDLAFHGSNYPVWINTPLDAQ